MTAATHFHSCGPWLTSRAGALRHATTSVPTSARR